MLFPVSNVYWHVKWLWVKGFSLMYWGVWGVAQCEPTYSMLLLSSLPDKSVYGEDHQAGSVDWQSWETELWRAEGGWGASIIRITFFSQKEGQWAVSWRSYLEEEPKARCQKRDKKDSIPGVENPGRYTHCLVCCFLSLSYPQIGAIQSLPTDPAPVWISHIRPLCLWSEIKLNLDPKSASCINISFSNPRYLHLSSVGENIYPPEWEEEDGCYRKTPTNEDWWQW